jgi:recombinational DNA repair protein (RecF pathway)
MAEDADPGFLLVVFELGLLELLGFMPDMEHCASCGKAIAAGEAVALDTLSGVILGEGHPCAYEEQRGHDHARSEIPRGVFAVLRRLQGVELGVIGRIRVSDGQRQGLASLCARLFRIHTGRLPRSRSMLFGKQ